jgi:hypothetical protein
MQEVRRNEFKDLLEMNELMFVEHTDFIKADIPELGACTYYPKKNRLNIHLGNKWESDGFYFVRNHLVKEKVVIRCSLGEKSEPLTKGFILCASLNFNGIIISGHRHSDCYEILRKLKPELKDDELPGRETQGFITSENRFVDRKEGWKIAKENNQIKWGLEASENGNDSQLISENLY